MIITLTPAQVTEITNPFWAGILLDDGAGNSLGTYADDLIQEIPAAEVVIGQLAAQGLDPDGTGTITGWACAHPDLTDEDATLITYELQWRADQMATIAALPAPDRPAARTTLRASIRVAARQEARRAERVALRQSERIEDRVEARRLARLDLRARAVAAGELPA
jgi:hypothetical protein